jgi:hypothetical protein
MEYFGFWSEEDGELPPLPTKQQPPDPAMTALFQVLLDIFAASFIARLAILLVWGVSI